MDIPADLTITMTDITRTGHCARGTRTFFAANGLNFRAFLKNGIAATDLAATGDGIALQVIERKLREPSNG